MDWLWRNIFKKFFFVIPNYQFNINFIELDLKYNESYLIKLEKRQEELMRFVKEYELKNNL